MTECLSEVTLQALFDGELDRKTTGRIVAHLGACENCSRAAATAENENRLLTEALQLEFANAAPYERAYQRIERAISRGEITSAARAGISSRHRWWNAPAAILFSSNRSALAAAVLALVVLSTILIAAYLRPNAPTRIARLESKAPVSIASPAPTSEPDNLGSAPGHNDPEQPRAFAPRKSASRTRRTVSKPLPGEDDFERQIAALAATIESDPPMQTGLRVEYEHNLELLNEVIELTRNAARNNPRDPQGAQFMFASFQDKINLLKQVADARRLGARD